MRNPVLTLIEIDMIRERAFREYPLTMPLLESLQDAIAALCPPVDLTQPDAAIALVLSEAIVKACEILRAALTVHEQAEVRRTTTTTALCTESSCLNLEACRAAGHCTQRTAAVR